MMTAISVSKITLKIATAVFYSLCLSGLIWQITQISINYFAFNVVSDIKIILPEEKSNTTILNVCFRYPEIYNISVFNDLISKYAIKESNTNEAWKILFEKIKIREIFQVAINHDEMFFAGNETLIIQEYIALNQICYQIQNMENQGGVRNLVYLRSDRLENITLSFLFVSQLLPYIDTYRFQILTELRKKNEPTLILITENSYKISKLTTPYIENCINYRTLNFRNRNDAILTCVNNAKLRKHNAIYQGKVVMKSDTKFMNYTFIHEVYNPLDADCIACKTMYSIHGDCNQEVIFTQLSAKNVSGIKIDTTDIILLIVEGNQPSFKIVSKPKIDDIDFITYILGALGSWFGFSFLACNPIPFILKVKDGSSSKEVKAMGEKEKNSNSCRLRKFPLTENLHINARMRIMESKCEIFYQKFDRMSITLSKISRQFDTIVKRNEPE